jgi:hypothetical protein
MMARAAAMPGMGSGAGGGAYRVSVPETAAASVDALGTVAGAKARGDGMITVLQPGELLVAVAENHLAGRTPPTVPPAALDRVRTACASCNVRGLLGSVGGHTMRLKVVFNGSRQPARIELLDPQRLKPSASMLRCLQDALTRAFILPAPASGYVVLSVR